MPIKKSRPGAKPKYDRGIKSTVCIEVLAGNLSISEASRMYGIKPSTTSYWIKQYQEQLSMVNLGGMNTTPQENNPSEQPAQDDLHRRNQELEEALKLAKLKITALEMMIDIAESELKIDIRKKSGTKQ